MIYAFGIFAKAFTAEYGWDRSVQSFCLTSFLIATGFGTVWLGQLIGRWGVRRPAAAFMAVFAASLAIVAALPPSKPLFYTVFAILGVTGAAGTAMPYAVAVTAWFNRNRGLALGLVNTGAGLGAVLAPQYANYLETQFGWRIGFVGLAAVVAIIALFGLLVLVRDPPASRTGGLDQAGLSSLLPYLAEKRFWFIAIPILGVSIATFGVMGSLVPMLSDRDVAAGTIAVVLSTSGLSSWVGRVLVGYTMDRVFAPYVAAFTFALALIGIALVSVGGSGIALVTGAALIGFTLGAEGDLVTYLVSRYFSMESYSRVLGAMWVTWAWGGGIGTSLVGVTYMLTHSYQSAMAVFALVLLICTIVVCRLGPYGYSVEGRTADSPSPPSR